MADQSNNREDFMDDRTGAGGGRTGNNESGRGTTNDRGNGGDGMGREVTSSSGAVRKTPRGFAAMDPQAQRAIAAKGGRAAHQKGTAHEFTSEEARIAGRKGGEASRGGRRSSGNNNSNS